jgi:hypothetical protein
VDSISNTLRASGARSEEIATLPATPACIIRTSWDGCCAI